MKRLYKHVRCTDRRGEPCETCIADKNVKELFHRNFKAEDLSPHKKLSVYKINLAEGYFINHMNFKLDDGTIINICEDSWAPDESYANCRMEAVVDGESEDRIMDMLEGYFTNAKGKCKIEEIERE